MTKTAKNGKAMQMPQQAPPPQPKRKYFSLNDLEVGKSYYCRLSGAPILITEVNSDFTVNGKMFIQPKGEYATVSIAEEQLFTFEEEK